MDHRGPAKPPPIPFRPITDEVLYAGRRETFEYLHQLGILNYSSWDDVYFLDKDGVLLIFTYQ